jgi:hypothetical protein
MGVYEAGQIPRSETKDIQIFKIQRNRLYREKWVVGDLNYTVLDSSIKINSGLINDVY